MAYLFDNQLEKKFYYKGIIRNELKMSGLPLMDTIDKYEFTVTFLKRKPQVCEIIFNLEYLDLFIGFEAMKDYVDSFEGLMNVNKRLHLELSQDEKEFADTVKNITEVSKNWNNFKKKLYVDENLKRLPSEKRDEMVNVGDKEYYSSKNVCKSINNHILYKTFFMPLFIDANSQSKREPHSMIDYSNLFASGAHERTKIPLLRSIRVKENSEEGKNMLTLNYKIDRDNFDDKTILKAMSQQYPSLRQRVARYLWEANYQYSFDPNTGIVDTYEFSYFEQLNDDLESNNFCKMELVKDKKHG